MIFFKRLLCALCLTYVAGSLQAQPKPGPVMTDVVPAVTADPLVNPGMGLYLFGTSNAGDFAPDAWYAPMLNIGYFRTDWSVVQPDDDSSAHFDSYFKPIFDLYVNQLHRRVAFRFMSQNMHSQSKYVTPKWVFDRGVPSVTHKGIYAPEQIDPVFWDERYLAIQERFIADLGKYLDGRPGLEFIDIGSIGEWGEMHLARWTPDQLQGAGYTAERYISAYRRIIAAFARAFPHTRVFLNVGDYDTINDYAAIHGVNFRQDGLNPSGPSADVGKRFYRSYSRRGILCNYELYADYNEMKQRGWGVSETFAKGLEDPISYLHINLMGYADLKKAPEEVRKAVTDAARRIGFRFVLTHLRCNRSIGLTGSLPGRILLEHTWKNEGVAPCYASYALRWTLTNAEGRAVAEQTTYPVHPTTLWWPGEETTLHDVMSVPADTPPGEYRLRVAMVEPEQPSLRIQLGIAGRDADGRYDLCAITAARRAAGQATIYTEDFERSSGGWSPTAGMTATLDSAAHAGHGSLLVEGTQQGTEWSYATVNLRAPIVPASRYRLSCWMRVESVTPGTQAPYCKMAITTGDGKWLRNFETNSYDLGKRGTWQHLTAFIETTPDTANGQLAIEKGSQEGKYGITLHLDDITLELIESP